MAWSEQTKEALKRWLAPSTWNTSGSSDEAHFSVFVASVWNDEHAVWDEAQVREEIREKAIKLHPKYSDQLAEEEAETRVSKGTTILKFLSYVRAKDKLALLWP